MKRDKGKKKSQDVDRSEVVKCVKGIHTPMWSDCKMFCLCVFVCVSCRPFPTCVCECLCMCVCVRVCVRVSVSAGFGALCPCVVSSLAHPCDGYCGGEWDVWR